MKLSLRHPYVNYVSLALIVALAVNFYVQFFRFTSNIPVNDDYRAILQWLNDFKAAGSFSDRLTLLFSQSNEHRLVYNRLWILANYKATGQVNFNFLAAIGNLSYIGFFLLLSWSLIKKGWLYVLPVAVLIFNLAFHENLTFPMATLANNTGLLFGLLSVYFAAASEKRSYLSIVFYVFAVFTVGSGLFLTPLIPAILWYRKHKMTFWVFWAIALTTLAIYFIGYHKPEQTPDIFQTIGFFKFKALMFFFSFVGGIFGRNLIFTNDLYESVVFCALAGLLMVAFYGYLIKRKYYKENLFVFSVMTFVILAAGLTAITRAQFGIETAIASRYRMYSAVLLICCYMYLVSHSAIFQQWREAVILAFSIGYFVFVGNPQIEYLAYRKHMNYLGVINYHSGNHKALNGFEQDAYKIILEQSKYNQIYELPGQDQADTWFPHAKAMSPISRNTNTDLWFVHNVEQVFELKDSFLIFGMGFLDGQGTTDQLIFLELRDPATGQTKSFTTEQMKRYDMNPYFKKYNLDYGGFFCRIKKDQLGSGEYTIGLSIVNGDLFRREQTDKKIKKTF